MINLRLVIPGDCRVKKNSMKEMWYRIETDPNTGLKKKIPLSKPIKYYTKQYRQWAKQAVQYMSIYKSNLLIRDGVKLPMTGQLFLSAIFFLSDDYIVDISNLIEGVQDLLAGNAGNFFPKHFSHDSYKIISDDNKKIVKCLGLSTVMIDPLKPRTEIFLSNFTLPKFGELFRLMHPGLEISTGLKKDEPQFDLGEDDSLLKLITGGD